MLSPAAAVSEGLYESTSATVEAATATATTAMSVARMQAAVHTAVSEAFEAAKNAPLQLTSSDRYMSDAEQSQRDVRTSIAAWDGAQHGRRGETNSDQSNGPVMGVQHRRIAAERGCIAAAAELAAAQMALELEGALKVEQNPPAATGFWHAQVNYTTSFYWNGTVVYSQCILHIEYVQ